MGSKKHKKHKSERREKYDDRPFCLERPPSLKLILKVGGGGSSSTPEYGSSESPVYGVQPENLGLLMDYPERHKKSKKKKKKKDREKKHKHHKEKRRHRDGSRDRTENEQDESSQEDFSINEDSAQFQNQLIGDSSSPASMPTMLLGGDSNSPASVPMSRTPLTMPLNLEPFTPPSVAFTSEQSPSICSMRSDSMKSPSSISDSGREPRTCVLKMKQSKSPLVRVLDHLLRILEKKDPHQYFAWPVTDEIAPGYSSIIANPMDFLTIRQKVDENQYNTLQEFATDFRLMCDNAIKYNHIETVYNKAAKKLLHVGTKLLQPESLARILRPLQPYMQELGHLELGFDMAQSLHPENDAHNLDSADEGLSTGAEEVNIAQLEEEVKRQNIRMENEPNTRFDPFVDDLTPEEILEQVKAAATKVKKKFSDRKKASKMGFLRQKKDGSTSMQILVDVENSCPERIVSIGALVGKLQNGTGQLHGFREDRRNNAKVVKPLNYGTFCSFAPLYDSRFANLSKEESELVLNTYGDEAGSEYAASLMEFTKDSQNGNALANSLLDYLTNGEHRKAMAKLIENSRDKFEQYQLEQSFPNPSSSADDEKLKNVKIDFDSLRSLSDLGLNVEFLGEMEENIKTIEAYKELQGKLKDNSELLEQLNMAQNERLSQNLPLHLSNVAHPNENELKLANQITNNLTEMAKQLPPYAIVSPYSLRKAMGVSNVGLEPIDDSFQKDTSSTSGIDSTNAQPATDLNTSSMPMEIDSEPTNEVQTMQVDAPTEQPVDLESELREFLEGDTTNLATTDDVANIDQLLA